jgi:uncharacterized protein (DUF58 family)
VGKRDKTAKKCRIRFRFTRAGWIYLVVSVLICVAATNNTDAPLLYAMFGLMMGALFASAAMARRVLKRVELRRDIPERVWQNQTIHLGYYLRNPRRRGAALGLSIEEIAPQGIECAPGYCVHLPARGIFRSGGRFAAKLRGRIRMGQVRLSTTFPLGLVRARQQLNLSADMVVWPARGRLKRQLLHYGAAETSRSAPSPATGGQDEFFGLREYRPDDNPRWIHWRRSAGREVPVVREMSRPLPEVLWVVLDTFWEDASQASIRRRERLIRFAGTLIDYAVNRGYQVGLALAYSGGVKILRPAAGRGQHRLLLDALADIDVNTVHRFEHTLGRLNEFSLRDAVVVLAAERRERVLRLPLTGLRAHCQHLAALSGDRLSRTFEDNAAFTGGAREKR